MATKPIVLVISSDHHPGGTTAVCPPEGVRLDDGGEYHPSRPQVWLWHQWVDFNQRGTALAKQAKAERWDILAGDLFEGDHHRTTQIVSGNPDAQNYVANRVFSVTREHRPKRLFVVRGTEDHVGHAGSAEEALAKAIGAERDPETHLWSRWHLRLNVNGQLFDVQHHGRAGGRVWTSQNALNAQAWDLHMEYHRKGYPVPDVAVRAHAHTFGDTYEACPTRLLMTGSWQFKTGYAHKVAPNKISDIGGYLVLVEPDGKMQVTRVQYKPELPKVV